MQSISAFISCPGTVKAYRTSERAFTRDRKLTFELLVLFLMSMPKRTLALELHDYLARFKKGFKQGFQKITPGALTQRREKLVPELFVGINDVVLQEYYTDNDERVSLWNGFRLLGIDGSRITLPNTNELKDIYGTIKNHSDIIQARVSVIYDILNEMVIEGIISPIEYGEITLAHKHIKRVQQNDLLLLDRGYPSFALAMDILQAEGQFLFRCKAAFNKVTQKFAASDSIDKIVEISPKQKQSFKEKSFNAGSKLKVRLLKIKLKSGEEEILMTSLTDKQEYPYSLFAGLYYKRWRVEVFYDRIKNILALENFSGLTHHAILQDFYCALVISNIQSLLIEEAQEELDKEQSNRKYEYKVNVSLSLGFMKYRIIDVLSKKQPQKALKELKSILLINPQPERKDRSFIRNTEKYSRRKKPPMFKNRKRNI
jgi:hypothetical protein